MIIHVHRSIDRYITGITFSCGKCDEHVTWRLELRGAKRPQLTSVVAFRLASYPWYPVLWWTWMDKQIERCERKRRGEREKEIRQDRASRLDKWDRSTRPIGQRDRKNHINNLIRKGKNIRKKANQMRQQRDKIGEVHSLNKIGELDTREKVDRYIDR